MKNKELQEYLQNQIVQSMKRLKSLANDAQGAPLFKRSIFTILQRHITSFLQNKNEPRIIIMPGLRGTGKTTLLAQLFLSLPHNQTTSLYLSIDEAVTRFGVTLWDIMENYEALTNTHIEELVTPLFLFFDEIHYDKNWTTFLKTIYDKSKNVMVFCSGSAALLLREQMNADVARRAYFVDVRPVDFAEYMLLKYKKLPPENIEQTITDMLFSSENASDVFAKMQNIENKCKTYWLNVDNFELARYLTFGTFPFTLNLANENFSLNFIAQIINKVIYTDISQFYKFSIETLNQIDKMLYLIADTLSVRIVKLSDTLGMKADTLRLILKSLETAGLLTKIAPYGSHFNQVKKPSKYLFATPALRFSYLSSKTSTSMFDNYKGSLFEDIVCMYLHKMLAQFHHYALTYDIAEGGADFIVTIGKQKIAIEVGIGQKGFKQMIKTAKKIQAQYSLIIADNELEYSKEHNAVKIPLKYFLLG